MVHYKLVSNHFCLGGGGGSVIRGDCEQQGGRLLRLLYKLRLRIRPRSRLFCIQQHRAQCSAVNRGSDSMAKLIAPQDSILQTQVARTSTKWTEQNRARICKRLRSPGIDSNQSIPPGRESILGLLIRFTNLGSVQVLFCNRRCLIQTISADWIRQI